MTLRIVDAEMQLTRAFDTLEQALADWAGGRSDVWQTDGPNGPTLEGASFARRDDVYIYVEVDAHQSVLGVALCDEDADLLRIAIPKDDPARDRRRAAVVTDEDGVPFIMVSVDELKRQGVYDVFRRIGAPPAIKRAALAERDYVLIGPLSDQRTADALLAVAGLHPAFDRHVERLSALADGGNGQAAANLYPTSLHVVREHRAHAKVLRALYQVFKPEGYEIAQPRRTLAPDFVLTRGAESIGFFVRRAARMDDLQEALGALALRAPKGSGMARVLLLPASRDGDMQAIAGLEPAFAELQVSIAVYDFQAGEASFALYRADDSLSENAQVILA